MFGKLLLVSLLIYNGVYGKGDEDKDKTKEIEAIEKACEKYPSSCQEMDNLITKSVENYDNSPESDDEQWYDACEDLVNEVKEYEVYGIIERQPSQDEKKMENKIQRATFRVGVTSNSETMKPITKENVLLPIECPEKPLNLRHISPTAIDRKTDDVLNNICPTYIGELVNSFGDSQDPESTYHMKCPEIPASLLHNTPIEEDMCKVANFLCETYIRKVRKSWGCSQDPESSDHMKCPEIPASLLQSTPTEKKKYEVINKLCETYISKVRRSWMDSQYPKSSNHMKRLEISSTSSLLQRTPIVKEVDELCEIYITKVRKSFRDSQDQKSSNDDLPTKPQTQMDSTD